MTDRSNDPTAHDLPTTAEQAPVAPHLVRMEATERDTLQLTVAYTDEGREQRVSLLITHSTPGAHDGLPAEEHAQPVLVVWGGPTAPLARVALRAQLVAPAWEPYRAPSDAAHLARAIEELAQVSNAAGLAEVVAPELRRLREVEERVAAGEL